MAQRRPRPEWVLELGESFLAAARKLYEGRRKPAKRKAIDALALKAEKPIAAALLAQGRALVKGLAHYKSRFATEEAALIRARVGGVPLREGLTEDDWDDLWDEAAEAGDELLEATIVEAAKTALTAGAESALALAAKDVLAKYGISWTLDNPRAVAYLTAHGAELVTRIDAATREDIRNLIAKALEEGRSYNQIAQDIITKFKGYGDPNSFWRFDAPRPQKHIESRAHLIAVTEVGEAYESGEWQAMQEMADAGLEVIKWWSTMGDERVSEGCLENEADGEIPLNDPHTSGDMHPLRFPGCRCTELYGVKVPETGGTR